MAKQPGLWFDLCPRLLPDQLFRLRARSHTCTVPAKPSIGSRSLTVVSGSPGWHRLAVAGLVSLQFAEVRRPAIAAKMRWQTRSCRGAGSERDFLALDDGAGQASLQHGAVKSAAAGTPTESELQHWEHQIHALVVVLISTEHVTTEMLQKEVRRLTDLEDWGYYGKWAAALAHVLLNSGLIELRALDMTLGHACDSDGSTFQVGDKVWVKESKAGIPASRWRRPYLPVPGSVAGLQGVVIQNLGPRSDDDFFALRLELGLQERGSQQNLYLVKFDSEAVSKTCSVPSENSTQQGVAVEVFESWLERSKREPSPPAKPCAATVKAPKRRQLRQSLKTLAQDVHDLASRHVHRHGSHSAEGEQKPHEHLPRAVVERVAVEKQGKEAPGQRLTEALLQVLCSHNIISMSAVSRAMEVIDSLGVQALGPRIVARAWLDPDFKRLLLEDAHKAIRKLGHEATNSNSSVTVKVVESTAAVHNLVVCTLCSCYPVTLLGLSPAWYKSREYREQAVKRPRELLKESFGLEVPQHVELRVHDSNSEVRYIVLPQRPAGTEHWSEQELASVVTRDAMIGVALPEAASSGPGH